MTDIEKKLGQFLAAREAYRIHDDRLISAEQLTQEAFCNALVTSIIGGHKLPTNKQHAVEIESDGKKYRVWISIYPTVEEIGDGKKSSGRVGREDNHPTAQSGTSKGDVQEEGY